MSRSKQAARSDASVAKILDAALGLYSSQGFGATSMREIAAAASLSVGNVYHHFANKEEIFERLLERYWERLLDPELPLNRVFAAARFPDDLEELAAAVEQVVDENIPSILLIYVDVIEFGGKHIRSFYQHMADRYRDTYGERLAEMRRGGRFGDVDPMVGVMVASRWFFYFFTVERCFGVPMHLGMSPQQAVTEFIRLLRYGLLPRDGVSAGERGQSSSEGDLTPGRS